VSIKTEFRGLKHSGLKENGGKAMNTSWLRVVVAAFFEVLWVIGLTHSYNFWTWTGTIAAILLSNYLMITAAQTLPAGTVYAVFVGLGTAGTVVAEILFFNEPFRAEKILLIAVLLTGVTGLKLITAERPAKGAES